MPLNSNKYVRSLALVHERLYCGCHDNSIQVTSFQSFVSLSKPDYFRHSRNNTRLKFQEIDLETGTVNTIQSGSKRLLGKANPVYALQIRGEHIYAASSSLDGAVIKVLFLNIIFAIYLCQEISRREKTENLNKLRDSHNKFQCCLQNELNSNLNDDKFQKVHNSNTRV